MNTLFVDCETSGLMRDDLDPLAPEQPHMVQLGAVLYDRQWRKRGSLVTLIRPNGWEIEQGAEVVHGISTTTCHRCGMDAAEALIAFRGMARTATRIVGHNVQFDRRVIALAIHRAGGEGTWWSRMGNRFLCTMETSTEACGLPGEFGPKFPSLEEAVAILCPDEAAALPVRHDAESDIAATVAVYRELLARGIVTEPDPFAREPAAA